MNAEVTIISLFIVHRSPLSVSQLADCFRSVLCAGETGTVSWRHTPHREGVASLAALESGVVVRADARDAVTEAGAGGVVSRAMATGWSTVNSRLTPRLS